MIAVATVTRVGKGNLSPNEEAPRHVKTEVDQRIETDREIDHGIDREIDHVIDLEIGTGGAQNNF